MDKFIKVEFRTICVLLTLTNKFSFGKRDTPGRFNCNFNGEDSFESAEIWITTTAKSHCKLKPKSVDDKSTFTRENRESNAVEEAVV